MLVRKIVICLWTSLVLFHILPTKAWGEGDRFLCEWQLSPSLTSDPYPEFVWNSKNQTAYRILIAESFEKLEKGTALMWDSGKVTSRLSIAEYRGKPLSDNSTYFWKVKIWDEQDIEGRYGPGQQFATLFSPLPRRPGNIRTFINFGQQDRLIADHYDVTFRDRPKKDRSSIITLNYSLLATMVIPSERAALLERYCQTRGITKSGIPEEFFLHLKEDRDIALHVGRERLENPVQTRRVPGWDPVNDKNGDGIVDEKEYANRPNLKAGARRKSESRIPIYYWGPPNSDYVMNIANPIYQDFLLNTYIPRQLKGYDGLFIDTTASQVPGPGRYAPILEIPDNNAWAISMQEILARIKESAKDSYIVGNGWYANPFVIDGTENEEWLSISKSVYQVESGLQSAVALEQRGKIQLLQYNPTYDLKGGLSKQRATVSKEKDKLFGLALYYLVQGDHTYFGCGRHPYEKAEREWFPAMEYDLGSPKQPYKVIRNTKETLPNENLVKNPSFETIRNDGKPDGWNTSEPIESTIEKKVSGSRSVKIVSSSMQTNNINSQEFVLEPYTIYTTGGVISTEKLDGPGGAQIYPFGLDDIEYVDKLDVFFRGTGSWRFCSFVFKTGRSGRVRINFRVKDAKGTAWFDDIFLVKGSYPNWKVYSREYEKGLVLVKVGPSSAGPEEAEPIMFDLEGEYRPLQYEGSLLDPIRKISLGANAASILIRKP